jgi:hypothetical protein
MLRVGCGMPLQLVHRKPLSAQSADEACHTGHVREGQVVHQGTPLAQNAAPVEPVGRRGSQSLRRLQRVGGST